MTNATGHATKEHLMAKFQRAGPLEEEDYNRLQEFIKTNAFCRLMHEILLDSDTMGQVLLMADLTTDDGVHKAMMYQGEARGRVKAVEKVLDLLEEKGLFEETHEEEKTDE